MTNGMTDDWREHARNLAQVLIERGKLSSPEWIEAVRSVPRHKLVPSYYRRNEQAAWQQKHVDDADLSVIYRNDAFFTALDERGWGVSSTSMPGLMTRMLELLDVRDDHRVLEIGTGTGYNAALLCHRLGDEQVFSVDIDYVDTARERLADLGYRPTLVTADGMLGLAEHAPYDRIIATCSVPRVPFAWVEQLVDGGLLLADLKIGNTAGNLVLLRKDGERAEGHFDSGWAGFMPARRPGEPPAARAKIRHEPERTWTSTTWPFCWEHPVPWFLAQFDLPANVVHGLRFDQETGERTAATLCAPDGSEAVVGLGADGNHTVTESGPTPLWCPVENAAQQWRVLGEPAWEQFGVTLTRDTQTVWLHSPDNALRLVPR